MYDMLIFNHKQKNRLAATKSLFGGQNQPTNKLFCNMFLMLLEDSLIEHPTDKNN